jgi:hypothetical protein
MVVRSRLARTGETGSLEKSRLPKTKFETFLEKRVNEKHMENLKKLSNAVKEVGKTSAWVIREGGIAMGDMLSMKYYWEAMDGFNKPKEHEKLASGLGFEKTMKRPIGVSPELGAKAEKLKERYVEVKGE